MQFLYPRSTQFPFDLACSAIVRELEKRNWQVPGISVSFHDYGSGDLKFRKVDTIKGLDFKIWFCRVQGRIEGSHWNDTAAATEIVIPEKELHVYEDESGPTFYLYVGKDWEADREKFMNGIKVNSKLCGDPRQYLMYKGSADRGGKYTYSNQRSPHLVHDDDIGREYSPVRSEPRHFNTDKVMMEFQGYLIDVVRKYIVSQPLPTEIIDVCASPEPIKFPDIIGPLFCFGEYRDAQRIMQGKLDANVLPAEDRYGLVGSGYRLASLDVPNDGTVPKIAYEGFLWCGVREVTVETDADSLTVPDHYRWSDREQFVIRVKPNMANDIYIADNFAYEKRRRELADEMERGRERFTNAEVLDFTCARARTIIPIHEYKGGYENPVVLVNRELGFDEVDIISGPGNRFVR